MPPKCRVSDDCNSAKPSKRQKVLSLSDKVKIIDLVIKEKKLYAEVGQTFNKNEERMS
jgi:hypothetical protein